MNRIDATFARLQAAGRTALIPYVTTGDPSLEATLDVMRALVMGGADVIELGVPFSDPMADGPVIQRASERALARGVGLRQVLDVVRRFRAGDAATPVGWAAGRRSSARGTAGRSGGRASGEASSTGTSRSTGKALSAAPSAAAV